MDNRARRIRPTPSLSGHLLSADRYLPRMYLLSSTLARRLLATAV